MPDRGWWAELWPDPEGVLRTIGVREGQTALDLCCGDGLFTAALARLLKGRVYALDLDPDVIAKARLHLAAQGVSAKSWIVGDASELTRLFRRRVDVIFLANTFHGVEEKARFIVNLERCLSRRGRLSIIDWKAKARESTVVMGEARGPASHLRMPPEAVIALLSARGWGEIDVVSVGKHHYAVSASPPTYSPHL